MNIDEKTKLMKLAQVALIVLAVFLAVATIGVLKNLGDINPAYNSISVSGEGEAVSVPDVATFSFSVSANTANVSAGQREVTGKMDKILAALDDLGVEEKDIKTTNYSVYPRYVYPQVYCITTPCPPARQVQDGYTISHDVTVKIRDTEKAGEALSLIGEFGATNLSGVSFTVDDPDGVVEEARSKAIADAKDKAEKLAKDLDVRLVRVISFYENGGGPVPYYAEAYGGDTVLRSASAPTLPTGENTTRVSVTVTYEIK